MLAHRRWPLPAAGRLARAVDLYEYQGKELFRRHGIAVSEGRLATSPAEARAAAEELGGPVVVKAQVLTGGRGKAGGIKLAESPDEAEARALTDEDPAVVAGIGRYEISPMRLSIMRKA